MSQKEAPRVGLLKALVAGRVIGREVATALGVTVRQVWRLKDRFEAEGAHDVRFVPVGILGQKLRLVDEVPGRGQVGQQRGRGPLQPEDHRAVVRCLHLLDLGIRGFARAHHPPGGKMMCS